MLFRSYFLFLVVLLFLFTKVDTFLGFPPGLHALLFLVTADLFCAAVILRALLAGTHLVYPPLPRADFLPQGGCPQPFLLREISTQPSLNHFVSPPLGFAIIFSYVQYPFGTFLLWLCKSLLAIH